MFLDRITLHFKAGKGGDGAVHFARIKYQPFAGPDGGDGGDGGDVVLVGRRDLDSLEHLRTANTTAPDGKPGEGNQRIGADAPPLEIGVPLGTVVEDSDLFDELGAVCSGGQRLVAAKGGYGGKGNPKYATGRRRAPRLAQPGFPGAELDAVLSYRIYCDTLLLEASGDPTWQLLPRLLGKPIEEVDSDLYRRKPRWVRTEHEFQRYDTGYLQFDVLPEGAIEAPFIAHLYWPQHICVNLCPLEDPPAEIADRLLELIAAQPLRRVALVTLLLRPGMQLPTFLPSAFSVSLQFCPEPGAILPAFLGQLTGGTAV
jgi:hypothetical protein